MTVVMSPEKISAPMSSVWHGGNVYGASGPKEKADGREGMSGARCPLASSGRRRRPSNTLAGSPKSRRDRSQHSCSPKRPTKPHG
jgi:hypothetical protein